MIASKPSDGPKAEWEIEWSELKIDVYVINHQNSIYFASTNDHLIGFKDNHIYTVKGFSAFADEINIESNESKVIYTLDNRIKRIDICEPWKKSFDEQQVLKLENQVCFSSGSDYNRYENKIYYDKGNQIIAIILFVK